MKKYILLFLLFFVACSSKVTKQPDTFGENKSDSVVFIRQPEIVEAISFFTSAYLYELKGNPTIAYSGYIFAQKYDSTSLELMEALMRTAPSDSLRLTWASKILTNDSTNLTTIKYLANYYFDKNEKQKALNYYLMYTKVDTIQNEENNYIFYRLGSINYELGNVDESIKYFNDLIKISERFSFVRKNLVLLLTYDKENDNTQLVDSLYREWGSYENINKYNIFSEYGMFLESIGKDRKGQTMYNVALSYAETINDSLNVKKNISSNAFRLQMYDKMVKITEEVLEQDPTYIIGVNRLAIYYYDKDSTEQAKKYMMRSLELDSSQVLTLYFVGLIETKEKKFESAKTRFRKAIKLDTNYVPAYLNLGYLELLGKNYISADTLLERVLSYDSTTYNSHYFYGLSKLYQKQYKKAVHHLGKSIELVPNKEEIYDIQFDYASALEKADMLDSAIVIFETIIEKNSDFAPALNYLGYLLIEKKIDIEKGGSYVDRALAVDPTNAAYIDSKAWYFFRKGEYKQSLELLLKAYEVIGDDIEILEHLGDVYTKLGNKKKAEMYYKKIIELKGKK